ncbi:hypothetical protein Pint_16878 [Pistacia integerrima]|uniref:Uncharacterized protein n=1 Tax=Pistacia integerrima TaxID=434235 RepID=A0ACC0ZEU7_9ROSI|nr:hypothetical protein Pint_16878 [Pistacia integerrima]
MAVHQISSSETTSLMLTSGASGRINALFSRRALRCLIAIINAVIVIFLVPFRCWKRCVMINLSSEKNNKELEKNLQESGCSRKSGTAVRVPARILPWRNGGGGLEQEVVARRSLAVRRVLQDDCDGGYENCYQKIKRDFSLFVTSRGDTLFTQSWTPISVNVRPCPEDYSIQGKLWLFASRLVPLPVSGPQFFLTQRSKKVYPVWKILKEIK